MNLPFQAVECYLDGVYPYPGILFIIQSLKLLSKKILFFKAARKMVRIFFPT